MKSDIICGIWRFSPYTPSAGNQPVTIIGKNMVFYRIIMVVMSKSWFAIGKSCLLIIGKTSPFP